MPSLLDRVFKASARKTKEAEWYAEWGDLAMYNSEVARGIVHTPEWKRKMAEKQERWNEMIRNDEPDS